MAEKQSPSNGGKTELKLNLDAEAVPDFLDAVRGSGTPQTVPDGNIPFVIIPADQKVASLEHLIWNRRQPHPDRVIAIVEVYDAASFIEYYQKFSDENSRVFADEVEGKVTAILDYHGQMAGGGPRWGDHRLEFSLRPSKEFHVWNEHSGVKMVQAEFADFIEDNAPDIYEPKAATMMEIARDMSAHIDAAFESGIRQQSGSVSFKWSENIKAGYGAGKLEIPESFSISIPVHVGTDRVSLTARMRFRINSGKLTLWYDLLRADAALKAAFDKTRASIADTLAITAISGVAPKTA